MYVRIYPEQAGKLKKLAKAINKEPALFANEAIIFYLAYLDAMLMENNSIKILEGLDKSDIKKAGIDADTIMFLHLRHFSPKLYPAYVKFKADIGQPVPELPPIGSDTKLINDFIDKKETAPAETEA